MRELTIRQAVAGDVPAIHRLEVAAFPAPWRSEFFESELRASGRLNLVAVFGSELAGYVFAMWFFDEMHVNKIAVEERYRRQGIAAKLMEQCVSFASANRITSISLEVRRSNKGAQDFYRELRFSPSYIRPRYYPDGEDAVVMTKSLV